MKITFVLPSAGMVRGGIETTVISLATILSDKHEVTLLSGGSHTPSPPELGSRVKTIRVPYLDRFGAMSGIASHVPGGLGPIQMESLTFFISSILLPAARAAVLKADVLSTHTKYDSMLFTPWAARHGVPSVFHIQGSRFGEVFRKLDRATRYVGVSESSRAELVAKHHLPITTSVPPGAPKQFLELTRDEQGFLLFVGRLMPAKGTSLVLRVFAQLMFLRPDLRLLVAGDGPSRGAMESESKALGIDQNLRFLGAVPHSQLARLYSGAIALLFPSVAEVYPLVPLEAMASGCPVISGRLPGVLECTGGHAVLVDEWNEKAWAIAATPVVQDSSLRTRLSKEGRAWAAAHTWERAAADFEKELALAADSRTVRWRTQQESGDV